MVLLPIQASMPPLAALPSPCPSMPRPPRSSALPKKPPAVFQLVGSKAASVRPVPSPPMPPVIPSRIMLCRTVAGLNAPPGVSLSMPTMSLTGVASPLATELKPVLTVALPRFCARMPRKSSPL